MNGFGQKKSIDFNEIFSHIINMFSIKIVLNLAASLNVKIEQLNMKTIFVHSDLKEAIYGTIRRVQINDKENLVCKLKRNLYSLK